jgi:2-methylisocitrate lyase-like PEP mutase family enzyme
MPWRWDDVIRRCRAYHAAGADVVFVDGIRTTEDLHIYAKELHDLPRLYNGMLLPTPEVEKLGFKVMITGGTIGVLCKALTEAMQELRDTGTVSPCRLASRDEITNLLGLPHVYELETTYRTE